MPTVPKLMRRRGLLDAWQALFRREQKAAVCGKSMLGGQIVKLRNLCFALVLLGMLTGAAAAAVPAVDSTAGPASYSLTPRATAICTYAYYCPKCMPGLGLPAVRRNLHALLLQADALSGLFPLRRRLRPIAASRCPAFAIRLPGLCDCVMPACWGAGR